MICPKCHYDKPGDALLCARCLDELSRVGLLKHQEQFVGSVLDGTRQLKLGVYTHGKMHFILFGDDSHSWCWERMHPRSRRQELWNENLQRAACPKCLEAFHQVAAKAAEQQETK